jgi:hypothetical protein
LGSKMARDGAAGCGIARGRLPFGGNVEGTMAPDSLEDILRALRWSRVDLAYALGVRVDTARDWCRGRAPVPVPIAEWLERLLAAVEGVGPPPAAP